MNKCNSNEVRILLNDVGYFCFSMVYFTQKVYSMMQINFGVSRFRKIDFFIECFNELIAQYNALIYRHQLE